MFRLFRKKAATLISTSPDIAPRGFTRHESVLVLLGTQRRQMLLEHIWQRTSLSRAQFSLLYRQPLERYAALVQNLPASESHHHAYSGGMLDHGLEIVAYALKLRQSRLLPVGTTPEEQAAQSEVWTAAAAYAALLHDLGKIAVDLEVELADGSIWHPWHGPLTQPYRFRYLKERTYRLHSAATALLYTQVLDSRILDWLSKHQEAWSSLLYVLAGQYEHAGVLGELVMQADQASDGWLTQDSLWLVSKTVSDKLRAHLLSQGIDGIPGNNTTLFSILQDHGMALATEDGKAIWKATVTGENGWSHTFTFLRLAPALIWDDISLRPPPFAGTVTVEATGDEGEQESPGITDLANPQPKEAASAPVSVAGDAIDDLLNMFDTKAAHAEPGAASPDSAVPATVLPTPSPVPFKSTMTAPAVQMESTEPKRVESMPLSSEVVMPSSSTAMSETPSGEHFLAWLASAIQTHKLVINDAKALVHTVADTVYLVSPGIFQRYAQEHLRVAVLAKEAQLSDWQWIQKQFEKMQIHRKHANGLNIWTCNVTGPRKSHRLHGYLLSDPSGLFAEQPLNNPYLELVNPVT